MSNPVGMKPRSPAFWIMLSILLAGDLLFDYYHPQGIVLDAILGIAFWAWWRHRKTQNTTL